MKSVLTKVALLASGAVCGLAQAQPVTLPPPPAGVQVSRSEGYEFVTITHAGNAGFRVDESVEPPAPDIYAGSRVRPNTSVGGVNYDYRISRTETTGGQYAEFLNAFCAQRTIQEWRADPTFSFFGDSFRLGAISTIVNNRITQWRPTARPIPSNDLSMQEAMMYCNWLHNGRPTSLDLVMTGAYDVARYLNITAANRLTGPIERSADARFWIPTQDEWVKAAHFDPNKNGEGQAGFWLYPIARDTPPIGAPPAPYGNGEANTGFGWYEDEQGNFIYRWDIPILSYPTIQSPWGLFDAAGGAGEITSTALLWQEPGDFEFYGWNSTTFIVKSDTADFYYDHLAYFGFSGFGSAAGGLRLATNVPAPMNACVLFASITLFVRRSRNEENHRVR
jgi:formylglycine-generating enzyme required for sulfatase activity